MESNNQIKQLKSRHSLVTIVIVVGILITIIINVLTLLNCWSMIEYADWEFEPYLSREGITELFHSVEDYLFLKMLVTIVATVCVIFFLVKLLRGKKYGFGGFAITSVVATAFHAVMSNFVVNAFQKIDVEIPYNTLLQIVWTLATIALLYVVLQIKKNGVSCWEQLE